MENACPICGRPAGAPYRNLLGGRITEGCISAFHDGAITGADLAWHNRPWASAWRTAQEARAIHFDADCARSKTRAGTQARLDADADAAAALKALRLAEKNLKNFPCSLEA